MLGYKGLWPLLKLPLKRQWVLLKRLLQRLLTWLLQVLVLYIITAPAETAADLATSAVADTAANNTAAAAGLCCM